MPQIRKHKIGQILNTVQNPVHKNDLSKYSFGKKLQYSNRKITILASGMPYHIQLQKNRKYENFTQKNNSNKDSSGQSTFLTGAIASNGIQLHGFCSGVKVDNGCISNKKGEYNEASLSSGILWGLSRKSDVILSGVDMLGSQQIYMSLQKASQMNKLVVSFDNNNVSREKGKFLGIFTSHDGDQQIRYGNIQKKINIQKAGNILTLCRSKQFSVCPQSISGISIVAASCIDFCEKIKRRHGNIAQQKAYLSILDKVCE